MGHAELQPEDVDESITPLWSAMKRTWTAFCRTTSIHGLKYTRHNDTTTIVRFIWILITIIMFICAIVMVLTFYIDYRSNPTRLNVQNDNSPVESLLFPGITICPEILFNFVKTKEYIDTLKLPTNVTVQDILSGMRISYGFMISDEGYEMSEVENMQNLLNANNLTYMEFVKNVRWSCNDYLHRCRYRGRIIDCDMLFQTGRCFLGYCCSFNINQTGLKFTNQYSSAGIHHGLSIILHYKNLSINNQHSYSDGFKLLINEHYAFPSAHAVAKFMPLNEELFISIRPEEIFCSKAVRDLPVDQRQCVFPHEYPLRYFHSYVGGNCELECRVANMIKTCECIPYFFNNSLTNDRICTFSDIPCLVDNFADIIGRYRNTQCICPNSCERFDYDVQLTDADLQLNIPTVDQFYDGIQEDFSVVHIFLNSQVYRRIRRDLLSNMVTLVANLGSAFSLFVGMSLVSAVEIIYYFTFVLKKYYLEELEARKMLLFNKKSNTM